MPEENKPTFTEKWGTWIQTSVAILTLLITVSGVLAWVDNRYAKREMSTIRHLDLQILIISGHMRDYERIVDSGANLTSKDQTDYELDKQQLSSLKARKAKAQGLDPL